MPGMSLSNTSTHRLVILHTNRNDADVRELIMDGASLEKRIFLEALGVTIVEIDVNAVFDIPAEDILFSVYPSDRLETCIYALSLSQTPEMYSDNVCIEIDDQWIQYQSSQVAPRASFGARSTVDWFDPFRGYFLNYWRFHNESMVDLLLKYVICDSVVTTTSINADIRPCAQVGLQGSRISVTTSKDECDSIQKLISPGISERLYINRLPIKYYVYLENGNRVDENYIKWGGTSRRVTDEKVKSASNKTTVPS